MTSISVVIPLYNQGRFIREAVLSALVQNPPPREVIIVDDGSTDGGATLIPEDPLLRIARQPRSGPSTARNRGASLATGELLAFLDADDRWCAGKLAAYLSHLQRRPAEVAFGYFEYFLEPNHPLPTRFDMKLLGEPRLGRIPSTLVVRRKTYLAVGGFDETLATAEDVEWLSRLEQFGTAQTVVPGCWVDKRVHDANLSLTAPTAARDLFRALGVARHRSTGSRIRRQGIKKLA